MSDTLYPTPHIGARPEDFASTVLMPGDPLRSKFIAETYLEGARLINNVRGIFGYTGNYNGQRVSVMASGMGMPSMGIYSYELYNIFGVKNIIRIGSAGSINKDVKMRDIVIGMGACTNSSYGSQFCLNGTFAPIADFGLVKLASEICESSGVNYHVGNLLSSDTFYSDDKNSNDAWAKLGVMAIEMEAAALYMNAARCGKKALAVCTISDSIVTGEATTSDERQNSFLQMIEMSLEMASRLGD